MDIIRKKKIMISLSDDDYKRLCRLTGGYSKSQIISISLKELEQKYPLMCVGVDGDLRPVGNDI